MPSKVTLGPAVARLSNSVATRAGSVDGIEDAVDESGARRAARPAARCLMSLLPTSVVRRSCTASVAMATDATRSRTVSTTRRATATGSVFVSKPTSTPSPATIANDAGSNSQRAAKRWVASVASPTAMPAPPTGLLPAATWAYGLTMTPPASIAAGPTVTDSSSSPAALTVTVKPSLSTPGTSMSVPTRLTRSSAGVHVNVRSPTTTLSALLVAVTLTSLGHDAVERLSEGGQPGVEQARQCIGELADRVQTPTR